MRFFTSSAYVLFAVSLLAQNPPPPVFHVTTSLVALDVVATDHSGRAITDLKPEELRVKEDGNERVVKRFELERIGGKSPLADAFAQRVNATLGALPKDVFTNLHSLRLAPVNSASTILLIDALNTPFSSRVRARREMLQLIDKLDPTQPTAIYALSGSLELLQDFSTDPTVLRDAIKKASLQGALEGVPEGELIDHTFGEQLDPSVPQAAYSRLRRFESENSAAQLDLRVNQTVSALQAIARRLESIPGRKNLIWLSGSFPIDLLPERFAEDQLELHNYQREIFTVASILANARVSVYPVDANGLGPNGVSRVAEGPTGIMRGGPASIIAAQSTWSSLNVSAHETLDMIAETTGGRAFYNRNDLGNAMHAAIADGSTYYALAFTPRNPDADGKFHKLKVVTTRPHVELRYRRGYYALDPSVPSKERVKLMRQEMSDALGDRQQVSTGVVLFAKRSADPAILDLTVDPSALTFSHADNGMLRVTFQVATAAFDKQGKVLNSVADVVGTDIKPEDMQRFMQRGARFRTPFFSSPDVARVRIAVRDLPSDRLGTVDVPIR